MRSVPEPDQPQDLSHMDRLMKQAGEEQGNLWFQEVRLPTQSSIRPDQFAWTDIPLTVNFVKSIQ